jgi:hypothetical protein
MLLKVSGIMVNDKQNEQDKADTTVEQTLERFCAQIGGREEHGWRCDRRPMSYYSEYRIPFE